MSGYYSSDSESEGDSQHMKSAVSRAVSDYSSFNAILQDNNRTEHMNNDIFALAEQLNIGFSLHERNNLVVNSINTEAKNKILDAIHKRLEVVVTMNEELTEQKSELEEESTNSHVKSAATKATNQQLVMCKIQEILLEKTFNSVNLRISCSVMETYMIERQELCISTAFDTTNLLLAKSSYYWQNGKPVRAVAFRTKAIISEKHARKEYEKLVLLEAQSDAQMDSSLRQTSSVSHTQSTNANYSQAPTVSQIASQKLFQAWKLRILTDALVVGETRAQVHACNTNPSSTRAEKVEVKFRHQRAKAILKAEKRAFRSAWSAGIVELFKEVFG